jgi:outer membrane scaffolding protein for murein synthesis (MipA/OmpV family)
MKHFATAGLGAGFIAALLASSPASALEVVSAQVEQHADGGGMVGFGVGVTPDYEGSDDEKAVPALFGHYTWESGRYVALTKAPGSGRAARFKWNAVSHRYFEFGPLAQYRLKRDDVDNDQVDRMRDVDAEWELGAFLGLKLDDWTITGSFAQDVSDESNGLLGYLEVDYNLRINKQWGMHFGGNLTWADSDYMETYFGVDARDSARSGLPIYEADSGMKSGGVSAAVHYTPWQHWGIVASVSYNRLTNDAEDSPLVEDEGNENQVSGALALTYRF